MLNVTSQIGALLLPQPVDGAVVVDGLPFLGVEAHWLDIWQLYRGVQMTSHVHNRGQPRKERM